MAAKPGGGRDVYFSADVETDGPIPGPYSMLSFALVQAGSFDGESFCTPKSSDVFYRELRPISSQFQEEALRVNGLDRDRLLREGRSPDQVMREASQWIRERAGTAKPVLIAYPLSFDWSFLYWYFIMYADGQSPFGYSGCFDIKTAFAVKANLPIVDAGRSKLYQALRSKLAHSHHALDDAAEQAEIFANIFKWEGSRAAHRGAQGKCSEEAC